LITAICAAALASPGDELDRFVLGQRQRNPQRALGILPAGIGREDGGEAMQAALAEIAHRNRELRIIGHRRQELIAARRSETPIGEAIKHGPVLRDEGRDRAAGIGARRAEDQRHVPGNQSLCELHRGLWARSVIGDDKGQRPSVDAVILIDIGLHGLERFHLGRSDEGDVARERQDRVDLVGLGRAPDRRAEQDRGGEGRKQPAGESQRRSSLNVEAFFYLPDASRRLLQCQSE
jgi:hypothetical protein